MKEIEDSKKILDPKAHNNWRFVPDAWAIPAIKRDYELIFK